MVEFISGFTWLRKRLNYSQKKHDLTLQQTLKTMTVVVHCRETKYIVGLKHGSLGSIRQIRLTRHSRAL